VNFPVIYADTPNEFKTYSDKGKDRSPEKHYPTQSLEDILRLPVKRVAAPDAVLLLWTSGPHLLKSLWIMEEWGFRYSTVAFTWVKTNKDGKTLFTGLGYSTRKNTEIVLLGVRGKGVGRLSKKVHEVIISPRGAHSAKPNLVRERIIQLYPGPRLEMYARTTYPGFTCIGDEITGLDIREDLLRLERQNSPLDHKEYLDE